MAPADELDLLALGAGTTTRLGVKAQPGARRSGLLGTWNGRLRVALRAPPEDGRANAELLELLAESLRLKFRDLELERGARSRLKDVRIPLAPAELRRRLLPLLPPAS